jgi:hypothetical protein
MKDYKKYKDVRQFANAIARSYGYGKANGIVIGEENKVDSHVSYGHRKYSDNQYVPNAYLSKFGWKNTYYQYAETTVSITKEVAEYFDMI